MTADPLSRRPARTMRLSPHHVELMRRDIADPGFPSDVTSRPATDDDYTAEVDAVLSAVPPEGLWVFAYGSLIWNPEFDVVERRVATARGWHRAFCLGWDRRYRGNAEQPGVMLALDRGGQCSGVAFRLPDDALEANMHRLIRREMSMVPTAFPARWISLDTPQGKLRALTFAMNRKSGRYISGLGDERLADVLATACGFRGSMAEYLHSTIVKLEELGIHDRYLWRLQELVAARIEAAHGLGPGSNGRS